MDTIVSPWIDMVVAGRYVGGGQEGKARSPRFMAREVRLGRLKAVRIGGRAQLLTRATWLDEYLEASLVPVAVRAKRS